VPEVQLTSRGPDHRAACVLDPQQLSSGAQ
jgi:hypothetical protein